jgi:hypothetical protein
VRRRGSESAELDGDFEIPEFVPQR